MPTNIEIKARVPDFRALKTRAESLSEPPGQVIPQEDIFFHTPQGRLKLRILSPDRAQLIFYRRPDSAGPKRSEYHIFETTDPAGLKAILAMALGERGVVRKTRYLYLVGQTRIHLDDVEGLGQFIELEVMLRPDQSDAEGQAIAQTLIEKLGVQSDDLLESAYMDLIEQNLRSNPTPAPPHHKERNGEGDPAPPHHKERDGEGDPAPPPSVVFPMGEAGRG